MNVAAATICAAVAVVAGTVFQNVAAINTKGTTVVIDAGSTGTRLYVYTYSYGSPEDRAPRRLQVDVPALATKRMSPGIAAFADEALLGGVRGATGEETFEEEKEGASLPPLDSALSGEQFHSDLTPCKTFQGYMHRLKRAALEALPTWSDRSRSLILFRGTAGVRALPEDKKEALMQDICHTLEHWGLWYIKGTSCGVLSGHEEGVLGWLALNQLLGRMQGDLAMVRLVSKGSLQKSPLEKDVKPAVQNAETAAMIEMGGASAQVVFELPQSALKDEDLVAAAAAATALATAGVSNAHTPNAGTRSSFLYPLEGHEDIKVLKLRGQTILLFTRSYLGLGRQLALVRVTVRSLRLHYEQHISHLHKHHRLYPFPSSPLLKEEAAAWTTEGLSGAPLLPSAPQYEAPLPCFPADVRLSIDLNSSHFVFDEFLHHDADTTDAEQEQGSNDRSLSGGKESSVCGQGAASGRVDKRRACVIRTTDADGGEATPSAASPTPLAHINPPHAATWEKVMASSDVEAIKAESLDEAERIRRKRITRARGIADFEGCRKYVIQSPSRPSFSIASFRRSAASLCALKNVKDVLKRIHPSAATEKAQTGCFGLVLMAQFLEDILRLEAERELLAVNEVRRGALEWSGRAGVRRDRGDDQ
ncbi:uncharacterized protein LOC34622752 [Cyclospora cayetanensis]|uniref:Uncharacterized protein LOC34622752 n=1 Tax=Cyclospora cayetanensis TaxID=88456 RepID=A0A6P6S244_9EIME|nr:uncharacterized protein LOC34622752 [Cyclospora cayetanensis]